MSFRIIILSSICSGVALPILAQEPTAEAAEATQQYERWEQFSPQVRAALLYIMAAGFDSMAAVDERGIDADSVEAHRIFLEKVLKLEVDFMSGADRVYFDTMLNINRTRLEALRALPASADKEEIARVRKLRADDLEAVKKQYGYVHVDAIIMQQLSVYQQKYMPECQVAAKESLRSVFRHFAEKLREESIMQF